MRTESAPGSVVRADDLDRAELLAAGFPAARLRDGAEPSVPGELWLVSDRPTGQPASADRAECAGAAVVAAAARGTGGAPGAICRTDGGADAVIAEQPGRARLGAALADNPALRLDTDAAEALRAGAVDPRLMLVLTAMTSAHEIAVEDFPAVPLDSPAIPRRQALLTVLDGDRPDSSEVLRGWFAAQQPPFVPSLLRPEGSAVLVGYPAPPISGLLSN